jgi:hypothetical protein
LRSASRLALVLTLASPFASAAGRAADAPSVRVEIGPGKALNSFSPLHALGAGVDRISSAAADALADAEHRKQVMASGWGEVSYRLNTELHVEAWHWNPKGTWSDKSGGRGYFVGDARPGDEPIRRSYGYALPHRGFTRNEGTENDGYSRLDDGDLATYWKSNPYLEPAFTHEPPGRLPPQWIVVELPEAKPVDTVQIAWGAPYARAYEVQWWSGEDPIKHPDKGDWKTFAAGAIKNGKGGTATHKLGPAPQSARFLRVIMTASSGTCGSHGPGDRRNCVGYAINEVYVGRTGADGKLEDFVVHTAGQKQSPTNCSSVDPWHEPANIVTAAGEQVGLDFFYTNGITRGIAAMIPVSVLYGTPEDSANQLAYLEKRGYPISYVELGEESDGQYMTPEHYAALYLQWAAALHKVDPRLKLGGPAFEGVNEDIPAWRDGKGDTSWFRRFLAYLKAHGKLGELAFLSFEHYPFDVCKWSWDDLYDEPRRVSHIMDVWRQDGLPARVPMLITEVNAAWQAGQRFVDIWGGLWLADYIGAFFTAGGAGSYYFHYLPLPLGETCDGTSGTYSMHVSDKDFHIKQPLAQFFASQLVTSEWAQPGDGKHEVYRATSDLKDAAGHVLVTAYALHRPDGQWALLLVNKDPKSAHDLDIAFTDTRPGQASGQTLAFTGSVAQVSFGADHYTWHPKGVKGREGYADPDGPPVASKQPGGLAARYTLPRASVTVLRGAIGPTAP